MKCVRCSLEKPADEFYSRDRTCKPCRRSLVAKNRAENIERYRAYDRARSSLSHRVELRNRISAAWAQDHPNRRRAQVALCNAVRDGRVMRPATCVMPGCAKKPEGHHPDYGRPLDVTWLCRAHHMQEHARLEREGIAA